jgi:hypothetical protein
VTILVLTFGISILSHQEKTNEGISKISSVLKDGGEQLSESASKVSLIHACTYLCT